VVILLFTVETTGQIWISRQVYQDMVDAGNTYSVLSQSSS
jgi:hypothetical protein